MNSERPFEALTGPAITTPTALGAAAVVGLGSVLPASAAGGSFVRLSLLTKLALCPKEDDEDITMDPTLNPLRLHLGRSEPEVNGTVVGNFVLTGTLFLIVAVVLFVLRCRLRGDATTHSGEPAHTDCSHEDTTLLALMAKARFGWLVLPLSFLYGGAVAGGLSSALYSETVYRIFGGFNVAMGLAFPLYTAYSVRGVKTHCHYVAAGSKENAGEEEEENNAAQQPQPSAVRRALHFLGWGDGSEWVVNSVPQSGHWFEVHHLLFDGYHHRGRYYMVFEQAITLLLAGMSAWEPDADDGCTTRVWVVLGCLLLALLVLLVLRPYIALYEAIMDSAVLIGEIFMIVCLQLAMQTTYPEEDWGVDASEVTALVVIALILAKLIIDSIIYIIDEYEGFSESGATGSFCLFLLCPCCVSKSSEIYVESDHTPQKTATKRPPALWEADAEVEDVAGRGGEKVEMEMSAQSMRYSPTNRSGERSTNPFYAGAHSAHQPVASSTIKTPVSRSPGVQKSGKGVRPGERSMSMSMADASGRRFSSRNVGGEGSGREMANPFSKEGQATYSPRAQHLKENPFDGSIDRLVLV